MKFHYDLTTHDIQHAGVVYSMHDYTKDGQKYILIKLHKCRYSYEEICSWCENAWGPIYKNWGTASAKVIEDVGLHFWRNSDSGIWVKNDKDLITMWVLTYID